MCKEPWLKIGLRTPWREGSHICITCCSLHSLAGRKISSWPGNSKLPSPMANERPPPLWTLIFLQWTFLQNKPSQLPPSLYKRMLSSFVLQTCLWFVIVCLFQIAIPMLFLKNSILLAELLTSFFQRLTFHGVRSGIWIPEELTTSRTMSRNYLSHLSSLLPWVIFLLVH